MMAFVFAISNNLSGANMGASILQLYGGGDESAANSSHLGGGLCELSAMFELAWGLSNGNLHTQTDDPGTKN